MLFQIVILAGSLLILLVGADVLVRGSTALAMRLGLSSFFIGLTIVGFGTSSPELAASITATLNGSDSIAVGNIVGSNIFNVGVILGTAALLCPIAIVVEFVRREVLIVVLVSIVPLVAIFNDGVLARWMGLTMLALLLLYLANGYFIARRTATEHEQQHVEDLADLAVPRKRMLARLSVQLAMVVIGLALLVFGSQLLVGASVSIAHEMRIPELIIGLTIVAAGTSAPELFTSVVAALRKRPDIAVGNVLGSNIFNVLGILGLTTAIKPQTLSAQVLSFDLPVMIVLSLACLPIMLSGARISRTEGVLLLVGALCYIIALFTVVPMWFPAP